MKALCLIFWMILTLILACSVIGLLLFIPKDSYSSGDNTPSSWMQIGRVLLDAIINEK
jgi:hypothetical protein